MILSGQPISQIQRKTSLNEHDEFLISRHYNTSSDQYFSKKVQFGTLIDDTLTQLSSDLRLNEMAHENKSDYAKLNHGHDYTNVRVYKTDLSHLNELGYYDFEDLMEISCQNGGTEEHIKIQAPIQKYKKRDFKKSIGELKFMAVPSLHDIDIDSDDFDGYVYPDGSQYSKERFPEAWKVYNTDETSMTFNVPLLSDFIKLNPFLQQTNAMERILGQHNGILSHTHAVQQNVFSKQSPTINIDVWFDCCRDSNIGSGTPTLHGPSSNECESLEKISCEITDFSIKVNSNEIKTETVFIENEVYPKHNYLPVLIYIGGIDEQ